KSKRITALASRLNGDHLPATLQNILAWMKENLGYDTGDAPYESVDEILDRGKAFCLGWAEFCIALCRASGIPARLVAGHANHAWLEIYINGVGWLPIEPQDPNSLQIYHPSYVKILHFQRPLNASGVDRELLGYLNMHKMEYGEGVVHE